MKYTKLKSVYDDLKTYDYLAKDGDFIEVTQWDNGEGYDININTRRFMLSDGELDAINYLVKSLQYNKC